MANQFLALSLFLMLLSFFIVLNSVSNFERQNAVPAVMNSLLLTFSSQERSVESRPAPEPSEFEDQRKGDTIDAVEGLFNANIAGFEASRNRLGTVLHVNLPMQRFENAIDSAYFSQFDASESGKEQSFILTLVTVLRSAERGDPYRVDMVYNIPDDPVVLYETDPNAFWVALKRAGDLAENLQERGMPKKMMSVGLKKGKIGYVDLYFYKYVPFVFPENVLTVLSQKSSGEETQQDP